LLASFLVLHLLLHLAFKLDQFLAFNLLVEAVAQMLGAGEGLLFL
jgi:hypothetical protein